MPLRLPRQVFSCSSKCLLAEIILSWLRDDGHCTSVERGPAQLTRFAWPQICLPAGHNGLNPNPALIHKLVWWLLNPKWNTSTRTFMGAPLRGALGFSGVPIVIMWVIKGWTFLSILCLLSILLASMGTFAKELPINHSNVTWNTEFTNRSRCK